MFFLFCFGLFRRKDVACTNRWWILENVSQTMQILSKERFRSRKFYFTYSTDLLTKFHLSLTSSLIFVISMFRSKHSSNWSKNTPIYTKNCIQTLWFMYMNKNLFDWFQPATATVHVYWSFSAEVSKRISS